MFKPNQCFNEGFITSEAGQSDNRSEPRFARLRSFFPHKGEAAVSPGVVGVSLIKRTIPS